MVYLVTIHKISLSKGHVNLFLNLDSVIWSYVINNVYYGY